MSFENHPNATAEIGPYLLVPPSTYGNLVLEISEGRVSLDKSRVPYGVASVTVPQQDEDLVEQVDPYDNQRVMIEASEGTTTRTFDLVMTNRTVNHKAKTVELELATDEALLTGYKQLVDDLSAFDNQASLRAIINGVLDTVIPGAALEAGGADDVTFYVLTDATNLYENASIEGTGTGTQSWAGNDVTSARSADWASDGTYSLKCSSPLSTSSYATLGGDAGGIRNGMQAGRTYTVSGDHYQAGILGGTVGSRARRIIAFYYNAGGYTSVESAVAANVAGVERLSVTFTIPETATEAFVRFYHGHTSGVSYWDAVRLTENTGDIGEDLTTFFDGNTPDTDDYGYVWEGTALYSKSSRIALRDRSPDLLVWKAGQDAWTFLEPLTTSSQLWLFCDEQRRFWLLDPVAFSVPGRVTAQVSNTSEGSDTIDSGSGLKADGIIARFSWRDADGNSQTKDDTAGTAGRVLIFEFDRPYPGPGTAAMLLAKRSGLGRTQEVTVGSDLTATPGVEVSITLPGTHNQVGTLQGVTWYLSRGLMDLESVGLREIPPGAIDLLSGTIDSLVGTIDSLS